MKPFALYITSFNDPKSAAHLMGQLANLEGMGDYDLYLSDQSTDEDLAAEYDALCEKHGYHHLRWENQGATVAKRTVVEHAESKGYTLLSQISEDFELTTEETRHPAFVSGAAFVIKDSLTLMQQVQCLPFLHWSCIRGKDAFGYLTAGGMRMPNQIHRHPAVTLAYLRGEISFWNWPYTARVSYAAQIWRHGQMMVPGCEEHRKWAQGGGGEWKQQWVSHGHGACLLANPVRHTERRKPSGSLP